MKPTHLLAAARLVLAFGLMPVSSPGVVSPNPDRLPDFDKRPRPVPAENIVARTTAAGSVAAAVAGLQSKLPAARVDFDPSTGTPAWVYPRAGFLTGPVRLSPGDLDQPLRSFLDDQRALFGFGAEALTAARVTRDYVTAHSQLHSIVWQQQLDGLDIFEAVLMAHLTARGELVSVASGFLASPTQAAGETARRFVVSDSGPAIAAAAAVRLTLRNLEPGPESGEVVPAEAVAGGVERRQKFRAKAVIGVADARLVWLPVGGVELRLCWEILLTSRLQNEMFRALVDAETGDLWLRRSLTAYAGDATYRVFTSDSPSPFSPGHPAPLAGQPPLVARSLVTLSALNTNASPAGWINEGVNETLGNNVDAHTDWDNDNLPDLPRPVGSPYRVFDFPFDVTQPPGAWASNAVVQLFYWCNWMHDQLYELGFTEAAGNFQMDNFGRGGLGDDALAADAQDGGGTDNANMSTPPDGIPPRMQMYLFTGPTPDRDGDYDAEVILHEYTHGLSNRRVGGGVGISSLQTAGMGEGWSDFYGLALLSAAGDGVNGNYAAGGYLTYQLIPGFEANYYFGIRRYPYSTDLAKNPLTFKDIDPAQADPHSAVPLSPLFQPWSAAAATGVHNQGEVWCVTLWEARARLIQRHGFATGNQLILQLVTDGMNLAPANPNFLQARDAILQADRIANGGSNLPELWAAFAKRGLGFSATSPSSLTTDGVREAFDLPDDLLVTPLTNLRVAGPVGGPFAPDSITYTLTNQSANQVVWSLRPVPGWLNVSATNGILPPGSAATTVNVAIDPVVNNFPAGTYREELQFSNQVTRAVQTRAVQLVAGAVDYFTELFDQNDNDLDHQMFTFTPDGSENFYSVCRQNVTDFPTDPEGGTALVLSDDSNQSITLTGGATVAIYTNRSKTLFVGSNGYLTQNRGDSSFFPTFGAHFGLPRVAGLFYDLNPSGGGTITWRQLADRVAVTYLDVPEFANPGRSNSFQIELFFNGRIRITYLNLASAGGLAGLSSGKGLAAAFAESDFSNYGDCTPVWSVRVPAGATEGAGVLVGQGAVVLAQPLTTNLPVELTSGDATELIVGPEVTVPAGQTNAVFDLTVVDDLELDGTQTAILHATAPGFRPARAAFRVFDNETNALQIQLPSVVREGDAELIGTIAVTSAAAGALVVELTSSDPTELLVPPIVVIAAGQTSAPFRITVMDDAEIDGPRQVAITARVQNWVTASASVTVEDNEIAALAVLLPVTVPEDRGAWIGAGQVRLSGITLSNLPVALVSNPAGQLTLPAMVTVAAGQSNASFTLTPVNNSIPDGDRVVSISASAFGFARASNSLTILDDDTAPMIQTQPADQVVERGSTAGFLVSVSGGQPMAHQWWFSNVISGALPVPNATRTNLWLPNVETTAAGDYWLVSQNAFGTAISAPATLTVMPGVTLEEALDETTLNWSTAGNGFWRGQTNVSHDGMDAAASGAITHGESSSVQTTVVGPGTLTFWWSLSSEAGFDFLRFYRDETLQAGISGEIPWQERSYAIPAGTHTLRWTYAKDVSVNTGQDRGWLDQVSYAPTGPPVILTQPQSQVVTIGSNATFAVVASGLAPLRYQWRLGGTNLPGETNAVLPLLNVESGSAGNYSVRVTNALGEVTSGNALLTLNRPPSALPQSLTTMEDSARVITLTGADADGNPLTYQIMTNPAHGTVTGILPNLFYQPESNYFGADAFSFAVSDGWATSAPAVITIAIAPVADPPVAFSQTVTLPEDTSITVALLATDPDGDQLSFSVTAPAHGVLTGLAPALSYQPATNYQGLDSFTFMVSDGSFPPVSASVVLTVLPVNDAPRAQIRLSPLVVFPTITNQLVIAPDGLAAPVELDGSTSSDLEGDPLSYRWLEGTNQLSTAATTTNVMNVGAHTVTLEVDDGAAMGQAMTTFDVLTPAQSIGVIIVLIEESSLTREVRHSLVVTLKAAATAFERGDPKPALNQLAALRHKVDAQVAGADPVLAAQLNALCQNLLDTLGHP